MKNKTENGYEDIIHLPHYVSHKRPHMNLADRAAQFAPFSAVVGHDSAVKEAARYTDQRRELDETRKTIIDNQLREIEIQLPNGFEVEIVYFQPDDLKTGGKYISKIGKVKKFDEYAKEVLMVDGTTIAIYDIYSIVNNSSESY
jgi:cell division septal protein FtsQ